MNKIIWGIMLMMVLVLAACAPYYAGYGYYDFPYYDNGYEYYRYPDYHHSHEWYEHHWDGHEWGEHGNHQGDEEHHHR